MAYIYYPGCQYTAQSPETSKKIQNYLHEHFGMTITACCRKNHHLLNSGDTAVCVCPTCLTLLQENAPDANVITLWEFLAGKNDFLWPDYENRPITVQDCMDTQSKPHIKQAVRKVLDYMNLQVTELESPYKEQDFCRPKTPAEEKAVKEHCKHYTTDTVVCYCTGCFKALNKNETNGVHLLDLLMKRCRF